LSYEDCFTRLKDEKWWARGIDVMYKLGIVTTTIIFVIILIEESDLMYSASNFFYAFNVMSVFLFGGIIAYHILLWLLMYIVYGKEKLFPKEGNKAYKPLHSRLIFWIFIYFIITSSIGIILGP